MVNSRLKNIPGFNRRPLDLKDLEAVIHRENGQVVIIPSTIDGMTVPAAKGQGRTIIVNSRLKNGHQCFIGWHEYFHGYDGDDFRLLGAYYLNPAEFRASMYAAIAVMPTPRLMEIGVEVGRLDPNLLRGHFEIPLHLARFRLKVLEQHHTESFWWGGRHGFESVS